MKYGVRFRKSFIYKLYWVYNINQLTVLRGNPLTDKLIKQQMSDKQKLIQSMQNLVAHISSSQKNQEQIFTTLSIGDLTKIVSNLQDPNQKVRRITLVLIAQLLYQNPTIQRKFCQLIGIPSHPGKMALSGGFPKSICNDATALTESIKLIKDNTVPKQRGLYWYIDNYSKPKNLLTGKRNSFSIDPLSSIVGVWILQEKRVQERTSLPTKPLFMFETKKQPYIPLSQKTRLNKSHQLQKNVHSQQKPQTTLSSISINMKTSPIQQSLAQNIKYRPSSSIGEHKHNPLSIKSQIKTPNKLQASKMPLNATERKNYDNNKSPLQGIKYIRPTTMYQNYTMPLTTTASSGSNQYNSNQQNTPYSQSQYQGTQFKHSQFSQYSQPAQPTYNSNANTNINASIPSQMPKQPQVYTPQVKANSLNLNQHVNMNVNLNMNMNLNMNVNMGPMVGKSGTSMHSSNQNSMNSSIINYNHNHNGATVTPTGSTRNNTTTNSFIQNNPIDQTNSLASNVNVNGNGNGKQEVKSYLYPREVRKY